MKKELYDKPVLCIYDIRAIQKFIFRNTRNIDILGAEDVIVEILHEALLYALRNNDLHLKESEFCMDEFGPDENDDQDYVPYFTDSHILAQVITIGGGNAFMLYRTGRICKTVNRVFSEYILRRTYSLNVAIAAVEMTDCISDDFNRLYIELEKIKYTEPVSYPFGALPIVKTDLTGNPVVGIDSVTGEEISEETKLKRETNRSMSNPFRRSEFNDELSRYNNHLAYVHIDGNNIGLTIGNIMRNRKTYKEGVRARHIVNRNILQNYIHVLNTTEAWLFDIMRHNGIAEKDLPNYYRRIHIGGDDINIVMAEVYAFAFAEKFVHDVSKVCIWSDETLGDINFSVCVGIAYVTSDIAYKYGIRIAEECCEQAKQEAKKPENLIDGKTGNWIDFQICIRLADDVTSSRSYSYVSIDDVNLCLRPYCFDDARRNTPTHVSRLLHYLVALESLENDQRAIDDMMAAYLGPRSDIVRFINVIKRLGGEPAKKLGSPFANVPGRDKICAAWYDALELIRFGQAEGGFSKPE